MRPVELSHRGGRVFDIEIEATDLIGLSCSLDGNGIRYKRGNMYGTVAYKSLVCYN